MPEEVRHPHVLKTHIPYYIRLEKHLQCEKLLGLARGTTTKKRGNKKSDESTTPIRYNVIHMYWYSFHVYPANPRNFYWWGDDQSLYIYTSILECAGMHIIMMICDEFMFLIHAVLSTGMYMYTQSILASNPASSRG